MKKILLFVTALTILSCQNDQEDNAMSQSSHSTARGTDNSVVKPEYFEFMGEAHNEGLEYVFASAFDRRNIDDVKYSDVRASSIYYFENIYEPTKGETESNFTTLHDAIIKKSALATSIFIDGEDYSDLSNTELSYLHKLNEIVVGSLTTSAKVTAIDDLNARIYVDEDLEDNQLALLFSTNSVAKNSLKYWDSQLADKWKSAINTSSTYSAKGIDWEKVAIADIAGFLRGFPKGVVTGAVRGALVLGLSSGGTGAIPGAVIGALGGGAASGITSAVAASAATAGAYLIWGWLN